MTTELRHAGRRKGAPLFYAGWAGVALFGVLVFMDGHADSSYAVFHVLVAAAICAWFTMTTGKTAPIVGAVLGALFGLQMVFFLFSDLLSGDGAEMKTTLEDAFGLLAAALVLAGAVLGLIGRRASLPGASEGSGYRSSPSF
jgi:hypothetical protein